VSSLHRPTGKKCGLRDYGTADWQGGDEKCDHKSGKSRNDTDRPYGTKEVITEYYKDTCPKCGAIRIDNQLGLEKTPELYVKKMVAVFREVWRVLRDDGTVWLNLGDSYAGNNSRASNGGRAGLGTPREGVFERSGNNLKPKDLCGIPWRVALALQADGWYLRSDIIWCLSGGTKVYAKTQKGEMPTTIKDLYRLKPETVQLWNGFEWVRLSGISKSKRKGDEIELVLRSGERISCTPNHKWPTQRGIIECRELKTGDIINDCQLPPTEKKYSSFVPDEIGWFVGLYIAEGSRDTGGTIQIASHISENMRYESLCRLAERYDGYCRKHRTSENGMVICLESKILNAIINTYVSGKTAKDKHLSVKCWARNNNFLDYVMKGYLDGDGHWDAPNNRWRIGFTRNYNLESDMRTLCARIGAEFTCKLSISKIADKKYPSFRGEIRFANKAKEHKNKKSRTEIIEIRKARAREFYDMGVDCDNHLFALASGILTHNSKPNPMPESVTDRPTKAHEYVFLLTKQAKYYYDAEAIKETISESYKNDTREHGVLRQRFYENSKYLNHEYGNKQFKNLKDKGQQPHTMHKRRAEDLQDIDYERRNRRSVWTIATEPYSDAHFATFPQKLVEPCILAGTSEKGCCPECGKCWVRVVEKTTTPTQKIHNGKYDKSRGFGESGWLPGQQDTKTIGWQPQCDCGKEPVPCLVGDIFMGSGTVALVSLRANRKFTGIELSQDYIDMAYKRLSPLLHQEVLL